MFNILECHNDVNLEAVSLCPLSRYDTIRCVCCGCCVGWKPGFINIFVLLL